MPQWQLQHGESYLVTGEPVIVSDLTSSISHSIELLLIAVLLVMAGDARAGLLRAPATAAARARAARRGAHLRRAVRGRGIADDGLDRGAARARRPRGRLRDPVPGARGRGDRAYAGACAAHALDVALDGQPADTPAIVRRAAAAGAPTIATAAAASAAAMLVLLLSPVPMVRGFGVLLVVGVAIALLCALSAGAAAISLSASRTRPASGSPGRCARRQGPLAAAWRGARELLADNPLTRAAHARGARRLGAPPGARAVRRARAGGARLGPGHADEGADRHHQARAAEPRLAAEPQHGRADHRRRRRNRADGRRQRPRPSRRRSNG